MTAAGALHRMATRFPAPFGRGTDRLALTLRPGADPTQSAIVEPYDFAEHRARFDTDPDPRYVLTALRRVSGEAELGLQYRVPGLGFTPAVAIDVGDLLPGMSVPVPLGEFEGPATRLLDLSVLFAERATRAPLTDCWRLDALLGTLAKVLWVAGWDRDALHAQVPLLAASHGLAEATGLALDLFGADLGVPRLPPRPFHPDDDTLALYHLDEAGGSPLDATGAHPAGPLLASQAQPGAAGRFDRALLFEPLSVEISVPDAPDLAVAAGASLTVECFVKPAGSAGGALLSKRDQGFQAAGWLLAHRRTPFAESLQLRFADGSPTGVVEVFANLTLPTTRFTHVAGVLDRAAGEVRLYVDGALRSRGPATDLGEIRTTGPLQIGGALLGAGARFEGSIDEVRISRVARPDIGVPVLGEPDDRYRQRLGIFQRWTLPTPAGLQAAVDDAVGEIAGVARPLVLDDVDSTEVTTVREIRIVPTAVPPGTSVDALGRRDTAEPETSGRPEDDPVDPGLLVVATDPRLVDGTGAIPPGPHPRRMRLGTRHALLALLDLVGAADSPGVLRIVAGYDPAAGGLQSVGRALLLGSAAVPADELAALAHRAGFSYVEHRPGGLVYASVADLATVAIEVVRGSGTATPGGGVDLLHQQTVTLRVEPEPVPDAEYLWRIVGPAPARAQILDSGREPRTTLRAARRGPLMVEVGVRRDGRTTVANRTLRIGSNAIGPATALSDTGQVFFNTTAGDLPAATEPKFVPAYLITVDPDQLAQEGRRVTFAGGINSRRMQPVLLDRLRRLLDLLAPFTGAPVVVSAWEPDGTGSAAEGRSLRMQQGTGSPISLLAARAFAAGFSRVTNVDGQVLVLAQAPGDVLGTLFGGDDAVPEGTSVLTTAAPLADPVAAVVVGERLWTANTGTDTVSALDLATGRVDRVIKVPVIQPEALVASPDGGRIYVGARGGQLAAVDTATGAVLGTVDAPELRGPVPRRRVLAHHPTRPRLYVGRRGRVVEVDTAAFTVARTLELAVPPADVTITLSPAGDRLWVATQTQSAVQLIDTQALTVTRTAPLPARPVDVLAGSGRVYALAGGNLLILDDATGAVRATTEGFGAVIALLLTPDGTRLAITEVTPDGFRLHLRQADGSPLPPPLPGLVELSPDASVVSALTDDSGFVLPVTADAGTGVTVLDLGTGSRTAVWPLGSGHGERLTWSVEVGGAAAARLSSTSAPSIELFADAAGPVRIRTAYEWPDHTPPYTVAVRPSPQLLAREAETGSPVVVEKDVYDRLMNVLTHLAPIGVEIDTREVRLRVRELGQDPLAALSGDTFPDFRSPAPVPPRRRRWP